MNLSLSLRRSALTRFAMLTLACVAIAAAQSAMTVAQLKQFVHSAIERKYPDRQVVKYLKLYKLTERLADRDLMAMIAEGPGPETTEVLKQMQETSRALPIKDEDTKSNSTPPPPMPAPSSIEQERIIGEAREIALSYTKSLPNFICLQFTRRYEDPSGTEMFHLVDTVASKLSYFEQREDYKVISVNGRMTEAAYGALGGAISSGEFGTMLKELFERETRTEFWFERWGKLRGHIAMVFGYRVQRGSSKWTIDYHRGAEVYRPGYSGLIYLDRDVPTVLRITFVAEGLPPAFPIQEVTSQLDYDYQDISGQQFLLPMKSEMRMREGKYLVKNETEFRNYHRYSGEAVITFETDSAQVLEEEKKKDQQATQNPPSKK